MSSTLSSSLTKTKLTRRLLLNIRMRGPSLEFCNDAKEMSKILLSMHYQCLMTFLSSSG
ncbi:unnamed protein product [Hymenolepis diminuta]|uniref:Uncharacterized protein n=1 Tax=Hymenolepis diminuta TaxID=6216 RepID=A0A564Z235_HYMDI|nr:unnamed protein product [Hymenolepis diminuta]